MLQARVLCEPMHCQACLPAPAASYMQSAAVFVMHVIMLALVLLPPSFNCWLLSFCTAACTSACLPACSALCSWPAQHSLAPSASHHSCQGPPASAGPTQTAEACWAGQSIASEQCMMGIAVGLDKSSLGAVPLVHCLQLARSKAVFV